MNAFPENFYTGIYDAHVWDWAAYCVRNELFHLLGMPDID